MAVGVLCTPRLLRHEPSLSLSSLGGHAPVKITHSAITSPIFELVKTVEVDLALGKETWPTRFEILRSIEQQDLFRCRVWQLEFFRLQSTFPQSDGQPAHEPSDHRVLVEWDGPHVGLYDDFLAADIEAALKKVIEDFRAFLEHTTLEPAA